ncbi:hypothetical protein EJ02DRAFT_339122 [Clathrospora elynae]|uniref:F-box domain-containing protein n=1 Tax=Clathrospora elynae TaxID=706981 RepID=A0A6A5SY95_9PLEO|nr:hypothetical protein EJ02DRAFT_339122 [Clathrospora elynae]
MGFFRRSMSSGSSISRPSTIDYASDSDAPTSRTSIDSTCGDEIADSLATITKPAPTAPILSLPIELVQQISSYLDDASAAAFCLSSRYIYYALGTEVLSGHVEASKNRFEKRRTIEAVVERAFPGQWFCAWCDKFHAWSAEDGPTTVKEENKRDCTEFNSYLHGGDRYALCYHHVRLAINRALCGPEHGILLSAFEHEKRGMARIFKTPVPTKLAIEARIVQGRFVLHTSFAIILPSWTKSDKNLLKQLWPTLPHILSGHRDSENGHTGLMAAIDNVVRRGWRYPFTQNCSTCATDWTVSSYEFPHATGGQTRLVIQSWRDLGTGRNPFEGGWRAHGVCTGGYSNSSTQVIRLANIQAGDVRRAFDDVELGDQTLRTARVGASSTPRSRIYRSFMRKECNEDQGFEIRRSRAKPRTWRTQIENEEAFRKEEEERLYVVRNVAEKLVRLNAETGRRI